MKNTDQEYDVGDSVVVRMPGKNTGPAEEMAGTVREIMPRYAFGEETLYRVVGPGLETITSARTMKKNGRLF
ncbi:MAG: hypothetical protein JZU65_22600 [Chlorobium sp.]|nr:hypothetical protein [Chlorobium sp.]